MKNELQRRSIRLRELDYSQPGAYFVTLCTWHKRAIFGCLENDEMKLNVFGRIVKDEIDRLPARFPNVRIGSFAVMPDHVHMVIEIIEGMGTTIEHSDAMAVGRGTTIEQPDVMESTRSRQGDELREVDRCAPTMQFGKTPPGSIPIIVRSLKAVVSWRMGPSNQLRGEKIWQRNYFERVIRTQWELEQVFAYIEANPVEKL